jgi:hypothetical protein
MPAVRSTAGKTLSLDSGDDGPIKTELPVLRKAVG